MSKYYASLHLFLIKKKIMYANLYVNSVWPWGSWHAACGAVDGGILAIVSGLKLQMEETQTSGQMEIMEILGPSLSLPLTPHSTPCLVSFHCCG